MNIKSYFIVGTIGVFLFNCDLPLHSKNHEDGPYHSHNMDSLVGLVPAGKILNKSELFQRGKIIFERICSQCHMADGKGIADSIPPLANSDYLMADKKRSIQIVLNGLIGEITVNGKIYMNVMPFMPGSDDNVASVLTFVRNYLNGATDSITAVEVMNVRMGMGSL